MRRERDSNPRYISAQRFSRPPHSTTLPPLQRWSITSQTLCSALRALKFPATLRHLFQYYHLFQKSFLVWHAQSNTKGLPRQYLQLLYCRRNDFRSYSVTFYFSPNRHSGYKKHDDFLFIISHLMQIILWYNHLQKLVEIFSVHDFKTDFLIVGYSDKSTIIKNPFSLFIILYRKGFG